MKQHLLSFAADENAQELLAKSRGGSISVTGAIVIIAVIAVVYFGIKALQRRNRR